LPYLESNLIAKIISYGHIWRCSSPVETGYANENNYRIIPKGQGETSNNLISSFLLAYFRSKNVNLDFKLQLILWFNKCNTVFTETKKTKSEYFFLSSYALFGCYSLIGSVITVVS